MPNFLYLPQLATATPDPPDPIDITDIRRVFGYGNNRTPDDDLNDYHGIAYYETFYPYRAGKFNAAANGQLTFQDFYSKSAVLPTLAGEYKDNTPGSRFFVIPPFFSNVKIEIWGGGGGGGAGDHDRYGDTGGHGTQSQANVRGYSLTSGGGGGGTGGYRYGNQSGSGGGGGTTSGGDVLYSIAGNSGGNGNAGDGKGGVGADAPLGGKGGAAGDCRLPSLSYTYYTYETQPTVAPVLDPGTTKNFANAYGWYVKGTRTGTTSALPFEVSPATGQNDAVMYYPDEYWIVKNGVIVYHSYTYSDERSVVGQGGVSTVYRAKPPLSKQYRPGTYRGHIQTQVGNDNRGTQDIWISCFDLAGTVSNVIVPHTVTIDSKDGGPGRIPGAGGGGGGYSDFQSGKNANPDRAAGGGGGSGGYTAKYLSRSQISPGEIINYTIGSGGNGGNGNHGKGGSGASGGIRVSWA